jgi:hypothetical protein
MHFICDGTLYEEFDGVAVGSSPLAPIGDNIYTEKFNKKS